MPYPFQLLPLDINGGGKFDLVSLPLLLTAKLAILTLSKLHIERITHLLFFCQPRMATYVRIRYLSVQHLRQDVSIVETYRYVVHSDEAHYYSLNLRATVMLDCYISIRERKVPELYFVQFVWDEKIRKGPKMLVSILIFRLLSQSCIHHLSYRDDIGKVFNMDLLECQKEGEFRVYSGRL